MEENKPAESKEAILDKILESYNIHSLRESKLGSPQAIASIKAAMESYSDILRKERDASEANLQTALDKYEQLQQTLDEREKEIDRLKASCKELNSVIDSWKVELKQKDIEIKTLKDKFVIAKYYGSQEKLNSKENDDKQKNQ